MKRRISISIVFLVLTGHALGQAAPTAALPGFDGAGVTPAGQAGPALPWVDGTLHYALSASEIVSKGYYRGDVTTSEGISGNVGYSSMSQTHPTSLLFAGGVFFGRGGQSGATTFQNVAVSQGLIKGLWAFSVTDSFSFLPLSPVTGVAGVPGVSTPGDLPTPGPADGPAGGILTYSGNRISNALTGSVQRRLTGRTSFSGSGSWMLLHFLDEHAGMDNSMKTGQLALNHIIDARNTVSLAATYAINDTSNILQVLPDSYPATLSYQTKGLSLSYSRQWTRSLSTSLSAGPMWVQSSAAPLIPNRLNYSLNASLGYRRPMTGYNLRFAHGISGGSGVQPGVISDTLSGSVSRTFAREWSGSASLSYIRTSGLLQTPSEGFSTNGITNGEYGTVQVTHGFTRTISGYASYTAQHQSVHQIFATNAFNGLSHTFGFGISWTPRSTRLGDF